MSQLSGVEYPLVRHIQHPYAHYPLVERALYSLHIAKDAIIHCSVCYTTTLSVTDAQFAPTHLHIIYSSVYMLNYHSLFLNCIFCL